MKKTARLAVSIALISFVLFSCAKKETVRPEAWSPATPSELIDRITYDNIDTLSGTASIRIFNDGEYAAYLTGAVNYKRPASLSMSVFGPFGITVMKILLAEGVFEIYIPNKDTLYTARLNIHFLLPTKKQLRSYRADVAERADDYMLN
ncbi:MAG TPA: hypothetical protein ENH30_08210, partial [Nitrospirae bacterium]|nr:hypothetical protein [Nitrospirota bacterium]